MPVQNLTGLEKPLEKLIEVVSEGLGVVANDVFKLDTRKIKRIGEAEAEAEKLNIIKKAEGQAEAIDILNRAGKRFALEQYNKQINLENIIVGTRDLLVDSKQVSDVPVEKDWSTRFMSIAQDVSREDIQEILSKILAGEIVQPGSISIRTLEFIRSLDETTLRLFRKLAVLSDVNGNVYIPQPNVNDGFLDFLYKELMELIEMGLLQSSLNTVLKLTEARPFGLVLKSGRVYIFEPSKDKLKINLPILSLTKVGKDLANNIEYNVLLPSIEEYINSLKEFWKTQKDISFIERQNL